MYLAGLDEPFTSQEIEAVLKNILSRHALGPYGFNGLLYRECWPLIKDDIIKLCNDFAAGNPDSTSINRCLITLIHKKNIS